MTLEVLDIIPGISNKQKVIVNSLKSSSLTLPFLCNKIHICASFT